MTPEQIDSEKADKIEKAPVIQPDKVVQEKVTLPSATPEAAQGKAELSATQKSSDTSTPPVTPATPAPVQKEQSRKERKEAQDRENLRVNAKKWGVDIDHPAKEELTDDYKTRLLNATETSGGKDLASKISGFANMLAPPPKTAVPAVNLKAQLDAEKRKRRARFSDALTAFGEGLQGRVANPENFASNRIQRQQDKEFQNFKESTEKNANTKWAWENKNTNDTMDWIDEQLKEQGIRQDKKDNLERLRDQLKQDQANKDRDFKQRGDRQDTDATERVRHNKAMEEGNRLGTIAKKDKAVPPFKPIEVYDDAGNKSLRSQADWSNYFQEAQKDTKFTKDNLQTLLSNYKTMPDGGRMQIANDYYNWKQKKRLAKPEASPAPAIQPKQTTAKPPLFQ